MAAVPHLSMLKGVRCLSIPAANRTGHLRLCHVLYVPVRLSRQGASAAGSSLWWSASCHLTIRI